MSPISSRKTVPRLATSKSPSLAAAAPVNAPFSCPKSSLSRSSRLRPAQFSSTNGSSARGPFRCIQRARTPFPEPVSPWMKIGLWAVTNLRASSSKSLIILLFPTKGFGAPAIFNRTLLAVRVSLWPVRTFWMTASNASSRTGLVRKWSAPTCIHSTASSMEPRPVKMMLAQFGCKAFILGMRSSAFPSGSE